MAAQIPIREDLHANQEAMARVREDKLREVHAGHDGTWVAHPGLISVAKSVFDEHMKWSNQIQRPASMQSRITEQDLLQIPQGRITEAGLRRNVDVALQYIESWLRGFGCVPIYNLMEDAATAEISRAQLWQWIRYGARLEDGRTITSQMYEEVLQSVLEQMRKSMTLAAYRASKFDRAGEILEDLSTGDFREFLTTAAYGELS
jgi:malate synthase